MKLTAPVVVFFQGVYYLLTGLWPVIHIDFFMEVSGYKTDIWLVKMVGLLTTSIGLALLSARKKPDKGILILSACSALSYLAIDVYYVLNRTLSRIYLADAILELLLLMALIISIYRHRLGHTT